MASEFENLLIHPSSSIREAIDCLNRNQKGIILVVDAERRLICTVTDGDIRRAVLAGMDLDRPLQALVDRLRLLSNHAPVTAPVESSRAALIELMKRHKVRQVPLTDLHHRVQGLVTSDDLLEDPAMPVAAVIMAGGYGIRLRPLTESLPKPMLPVQGVPLLERTIRQLSEAGVRSVNVTTHYMSDVIVNHLGDGSSLGVQIDYIKEEHPLGTAGALSLIEDATGPLLVINGDIVTDLNFRAMLDFHQEHRADLTVGLAQYKINVPYGVVKVQGVRVTEVEEKPTITLLVNAGVYLLAPLARQYIPRNQHFDMTELIDVLKSGGHTVIGFPICEYWLDIGQLDDYQKAQLHAEGQGARLSP